MQLEDVKKIESLEVYRGSQLAGFLRRNTKGSEFEFDQNFLLNKKKGISFHLNGSKNIHSFQGESLPPFFAGLLPEGLRLKTLTQKIKTSEDDLFSLLAAVGTKCVGDVYVSSGDVQNQNSPSVDFNEVDFYELFEQSIAYTNSNSYEDNFAGVQEKISASMINFPLSISNKHKSYILKLNPKDKPNLVKNEYLSLSLAKKCGLKVNTAVLVQDKRQQAGLLVERFDRAFDSDTNEIIMLHQEDACQFLNRFPADKYRLNFKEVLAAIQDYATAPKIEILKALQLYAFSYLIGNGDLHAKNISLQTLKPSGKVVLTPAYDIISTYIYSDHKMALKLNGRDDNIKRKDFIELGLFFSVPEKSTSLMLDKLIKRSQKNHNIIFEFMTPKQIRSWETMFKKRLEDLS